jgi:hypothetical protein
MLVDKSFDTYDEPKPPECCDGAKTVFVINYMTVLASVLIRLLLK